VSALCCVTGPGWPSVPALLTAASSRPKRATVRSIKLRTSSSWRTSARRNSTSVRARAARPRVPGRGLVATGDNDSVAVPREGPRRRTPDSGQRAGDQDNWGAHIAAPSFDLAGLEGRRMKTFTRLQMLEASSWERGPRILCRLVPYLGGMGHVMELRHPRYFVAVAEEGSLTVAAERRLHPAQPSLSRQIREPRVRGRRSTDHSQSRGIELTAAGRVFLDHSRLALAQVENAAASGPAGRRSTPAKPVVRSGFPDRHEIDWLLKLSASFETISNKRSPSQPISPDLALRLCGQARLGSSDRKPQTTNLCSSPHPEPLVVVLPSDHRLASHEAIDPHDIAGETSSAVEDGPSLAGGHRRLPERPALTSNRITK